MAGRANARPATPRPALLLAIAALICMACGLGGSRTAPAPSLSPPWSSEIYPYELTLPPNWVAHGAVTDEDLFESADGNFRLKVGSGMPELGQTVAERVRVNRGGEEFARCESDPGRDRELSVGGEPGILWFFRCATVPGVAANTIHGGVGYRLTLRGTADVASELEHTLVGLISGFVFTD